MVKNLPSNVGDVGSISGRATKIPHVIGQLSPHAKTTEPAPQLENPHAATTEPARSGAHMPQLERSPHAARRSLHAATRDLACHY